MKRSSTAWGVRRVAPILGAMALALTSTTVIASAGPAGAASKSPHVTYTKTLACEVTDTGGINDKSFNASAYLGLTEAAKLSKNIVTSVVSTPSNGTESNYDAEISSLIAQKCDLIVTVGFLMGDATQAAAKE